MVAMRTLPFAPALLLTCWLLTPPSASAIGGELGWIDLFNGENLDGWTQRNGTATFRVEGNTIVGKTAVGSPNSFLCTNENYSDFELTFDVKLDSALNSGVQIRSLSKEGIPSGRVNGPQVEIAANGNSGYLYGEAAGGWMTPDSARVPHSHFVDGQWNSFHVMALGDRIQVWINGKLVSDLRDEEKFQTHPSGFIGLQVHGIPADQGPYEVRWRNLRLRDLSKFRPLFNGKDLSGWTTTGNWLVQGDGSLMIQPREGERGWQRYDAYLWNDRKYKDFILDLEYSYPPDGNSGVFVRVADTADPVQQGIEVQILDTYGDPNALSAHDHGGVIRTAGPSENMSRPPHQWNRMVVDCHGSLMKVELNGKKIIDINLAEGPMKDRPLEGYIGLQDHGQPHNIRFRNVRIMER